MNNINTNILISFHKNLCFLLFKKYKNNSLALSFKQRRSVKDLIEACGIPHVDVGYIQANGKYVNFDYIVQNNDKFVISPYTLNNSSPMNIQPKLPQTVKFVLDVHLHKLAVKLRLLGFDCDYQKYTNDKKLANISEKENRILLSRDRQLLMHKNVIFGHYVKNILADNQVKEVLNHFSLVDKIKPFSRCTTCNGIIRNLPIESKYFINYKSKIPGKVLEWCTEYTICENCNNIYWPGAHYKKINLFIESIKNKTF